MNGNAQSATGASIMLLAVFLAAWQWGPGLFHIPPFIVPPLSDVAHEFVHAWRFDHLLLHTGVTVAEVLAGFILGSLLGAVVGYLLGMSPAAELALSPYILALQIAPKVAFAPLFILWMGFTVYPKILVAILIVFFPVMVNVLTAVRTVDPDLINLARAFKERGRRFSGRSNFRPRCRRCSLDYASAPRSPWLVSWSASWSAAMWASAICSPLVKARPIRRWCSSPS